HSWHKRRLPNTQCRVGHIRGIASFQQELRELTNDGDPVLLRARTFVRFLGQPAPGDGPRQFQRRQSFLHQEIVEPVQASSQFVVAVATGVLFLNKLIHERSENALESIVSGIIRHDSPPLDPTRRSARFPHPPSRRSVSIPNWYAPRSPQWLSTALPSAEAESLKCGVANGAPAFGAFETGFLPAGANT